MRPLSDFWGSESKQVMLNSLFQARFKLAILALLIQIITILPIVPSFKFTSLFNLPAILGLLLCIFKKTLCNYQVQKKTKLLLKIGVAKAIGGVFLAIYMGLKYAFMPSTPAVYANYGSSQEGYMKLCAIYFSASAIVDVFYSIMAMGILKHTKKIGILLKDKKKVRSPKSMSPRQVKLPVINTQEP